MNWIMKMFKDWKINITSDPKCNECGRGFKEHTDDDLRNCVMNTLL